MNETHRWETHPRDVELAPGESVLVTVDGIGAAPTAPPPTWS